MSTQPYSPVDIKLIVRLRETNAQLEDMKRERKPRVAILAQFGLCQFYRKEIRKQMAGVDARDLDGEQYAILNTIERPSQHDIIINALRNQGYRTE